MNTYKDRNQGFSDLVTLIIEADTKEHDYPLLAEKVKVMMLGKYQDVPVLANGNVRLVEHKMGRKFAAVLGEEVSIQGHPPPLLSNTSLRVYNLVTFIMTFILKGATFSISALKCRRTIAIYSRQQCL